MIKIRISQTPKIPSICQYRNQKLYSKTDQNINFNNSLHQNQCLFPRPAEPTFLLLPPSCNIRPAEALCSNSKIMITQYNSLCHVISDCQLPMLLFNLKLNTFDHIHGHILVLPSLRVHLQTLNSLTVKFTYSAPASAWGLPIPKLIDGIHATLL